MPLCDSRFLTKSAEEGLHRAPLMILAPGNPPAAFGEKPGQQQAHPEPAHGQPDSRFSFSQETPVQTSRPQPVRKPPVT